jgi:7-cyano-7-deazaguanine synthase
MKQMLIKSEVNKGMNNSQKPKSVILLSGGLDSTTTLALAKKDGFDIYALTANYGQRHQVEIEFAQRIAEKFGAEFICRLKK